MLENERQKVKKVEMQKQDVESSQKMIDNLMERVATVEKEKTELASQYEKYATISDEIANYKKRMNELSQLLDEKEKSLEKERADKSSIEHSQEDLLKKMKDLQKENDKLVVKLEGLKTENEGLLSKNKKLEDRVKVLEDQNKQQLQQINETLKMPVPVTFDREALMERSLKDVQKLDEIRSRYTTGDIDNSSSSGLRNASRFTEPSISPPSLAIPSINLTDEKRPASTGKELKIVPKIVEPSSSSSDAVTSPKLKDQGYTSTINSQDVPAIPHDSPGQSASKAFAEAFSRSGL